MSEFTWYSRLAILGGSIVLIVQAVTGRALAIVTVLAVIAVAAGLVAFIAGLIADARGTGWPTAAPSRNDEGAPSAPGQAGEVAPPDPGEQIDAPDVEAEEAETPVAPASVASEPVAPRTDGRVSSIRVTAESSQVGAVCPHCREGLAAGQVAAVCPVCGTSQHANCWIDADFHCSVEGCSGEGSLAPPERQIRAR